MGLIQANLHPNVLKNQLFIRAVDYLIDHKLVLTQKELARITGIKEPTFSNIRNDKKVVSDKTIRKLMDAFEGLFNPLYFRGESSYMLMEDYIEANANHETDIIPDRHQQITQRANDIQMAVLGHLVKKTEVREGIAAEGDPVPHLPTWADTLVSILSKQIAENEMLHAELRQSIHEVNEMKAQITQVLKNIK